MDISDQSTPARPTWRARIDAAWQTAKTALLKAWAWLKEGPSVILAAALVLVVLVLAMTGPGGDHQPAHTPAPAVEAAPGLQDQIDALRLRVAVLEAQADALSRRATAPRASTPRAGASTPAAPDPDQFADTSELVEPPTPPAPITRQSVDQFRASLRTPQPIQE